MDTHIINLLAYFDIFDYPLTFSEIKKYIGTEIDINDDDLRDILEDIPVVQESEGHYYLLGRNTVVEKRADRVTSSIPKFAKARIVAKLLSFIPSIEFIGVSGSLSMHNATDSDDIDFFIVTKKNMLWLTRAVVSLMLSLTKQKRSRVKKDYKDKICINMFMEEDKLTFPTGKRTLYTAHEITQLKTLFDRSGIYQKFLSQNKWINKFMPNTIIPKQKKDSKSAIYSISQKVLKPIEITAFKLQTMYMKNHKNNETIKSDRAFFHPVDRQKLVMDLYSLRSSRYNRLYLDNIWVDRDEAKFYMEEKKIRILN